MLSSELPVVLWQHIGLALDAEHLCSRCARPDRARVVAAGGMAFHAVLIGVAGLVPERSKGRLVGLAAWDVEVDIEPCPVRLDRVGLLLSCLLSNKKVCRE